MLIIYKDTKNVSAFYPVFRNKGRSFFRIYRFKAVPVCKKLLLSLISSEYGIMVDR
jgi:hypothetical protein